MRLAIALVLCAGCTTTPNAPPLVDATTPSMDFAAPPADFARPVPDDLAQLADLAQSRDLDPQPPDLRVPCISTVENGRPCGCVGQPCCAQGNECHAANLGCLRAPNSDLKCLECGAWSQPCCPQPHPMPPTCASGLGGCFQIQSGVGCNTIPAGRNVGCYQCDVPGCGSPGAPCCTALPFACLTMQPCRANKTCP